MSTFVPPASPRRRHGVRQAANRVPLRIKLITAVLALVVIALVVISVASINLFRDYQYNRASQQVTALYEQTLFQLYHGQGLEPGGHLLAGSFLIALRPAGETFNVPPGASFPAIPASNTWLSAESGKMIDVSPITGTDNWRVITKQVPDLNPFTGQPTGQQNTLIVGVDLGDINGTIGQLAYIDLVVGGIVVVALAMVGIAIVRTSLRPLKDIEATAAAIAAGDLSRRVPDSDPRTEVGRLGRALNMMLAQIESAFHARERSEASARRSEERIRQFVADASHELRTPLTAIRGYAEYYRQRGGLDNGSHPVGEQEDEASRPQANNGAAPDTAPARTASPAAPADSPDLGDQVMPGGSAGAGPLTGPDMDRIMERVEQ